jgi:hypothetical protein
MHVRKSNMERIKNGHIKEMMGGERKTGHHRHHRKENTKMARPRQKDARRQNTKMNYGVDTRGEKKKRTSKKSVGGRSTSSHDSKKFISNQWRSREEWCLVSGRR